MFEVEIKENRFSVFVAIIIMVVIFFFVGGFTFTLLQDVETLSYNFHWQFNFLITIMLIGLKDSLFLMLSLFYKLTCPCNIIFNKFGFYSTELNSFVEWDKIESIEYEKYENSLFLPKNLFSIDILYLILFTFPTLFNQLKIIFLSSVGASKNVIIKTKNKKELLKNASIYTKFKNLMVPKGKIQLSIDIDLTETFYRGEEQQVENFKKRIHVENYLKLSNISSSMKEKEKDLVLIALLIH